MQKGYVRGIENALFIFCFLVLGFKDHKLINIVFTLQSAYQKYTYWK